MSPSDVFVAAAVSQGENVSNAIEMLGILVLKCPARRLDSAVMILLELARLVETCKNTATKEVVRWFSLLVGVCSYSAVNKDEFKAI